jgi:hypothetical protein
VTARAELGFPAATTHIENTADQFVKIADRERDMLQASLGQSRKKRRMSVAP